MKRQIILYLIFFCFTTAIAQKYSTKTGEINFEASVPSFEEVKAKNTNVSAILNAETGDFAALALIKGFRFKVALMEEHFNENYAESSKFPKATFKGKIKDFDTSSLTENKKEFTISGAVTMHGETKNIEVPLVLQMQNGVLLASTNFVLNPGDFNIKIPKIVSNKISKDVMVSASFSLTN